MRSVGRRPPSSCSTAGGWAARKPRSGLPGSASRPAAMAAPSCRHLTSLSALTNGVVSCEAIARQCHLNTAHVVVNRQGSGEVAQHCLQQEAGVGVGLKAAGGRQQAAAGSRRRGKQAAQGDHVAELACAASHTHLPHTPGGGRPGLWRRNPPQRMLAGLPPPGRHGRWWCRCGGPCTQHGRSGSACSGSRSAWQGLNGGAGKQAGKQA